MQVEIQAQLSSVSPDNLQAFVMSFAGAPSPCAVAAHVLRTETEVASAAAVVFANLLNRGLEGSGPSGIHINTKS